MTRKGIRDSGAPGPGGGFGIVVSGRGVIKNRNRITKPNQMTFGFFGLVYLVYGLFGLVNRIVKTLFGLVLVKLFMFWLNRINRISNYIYNFLYFIFINLISSVYL